MSVSTGFKYFNILTLAFAVAITGGCKGKAKPLESTLAPAFEKDIFTFYVGDSSSTTGLPVGHKENYLDCTSKPALPQGLTLDKETCVITGPAQKVTAKNVYTLTPTDKNGLVPPFIITLEIIDAKPQIEYLVDNPILEKGKLFSQIAPKVLVGSIFLCEVKPKLPLGITLDPKTCALSGIPQVTSEIKSYEITVNNSLGSVSTNLSLGVYEMPQILNQPVDTAGNPGGPISFTVVVDGFPRPTFQWMKNGVEIQQATLGSYSIASLKNTDAGSYSVKIKNDLGEITSQSANLLVRTAPSITSQPLTTVSVNAGVQAQISVTANGTAPLTYQWKKNGNNIQTATSNIFTISNAQLGDVGTYTVVVSNAVGSLTSNASVLSVRTAPLITSQPVSQIANENSSVSFSVVASGASLLTYQWSKNGVAISGAITNPFILSSVTESSAGQYSVMVSNDLGSVTSQSASLSVNLAPRVVTQPSAQTGAEDQSVTFSVGAVGAGSLSYTWKKDGNILSASNSNQYTISSLNSTHAGDYTVTVSNAIGSIISNSAHLNVDLKPRITVQPLGQSINEGSSLSFNVSATGAAPLGYQWRKNGVNIQGATSATYTATAVTNLDHGNKYSVVVNNAVSSVTSNDASLTVNSKPRITQHPQSVVLDKGTNVTFNVSVTGASPLAYKWKKGSVYITSATSSSYTITNTNETHLGNYSVEVSNGIGSPATSTEAALTLNPPPVIMIAPQSLTVNQGEKAVLSVTATGATGYQWSKDGVVLLGQTSAIYEIPSVLPAHAGQYSVIVSNLNGSVTSAGAGLVVNEPPSILGFDKTSTQLLNVNNTPIEFNLILSKTIDPHSLTAADISQNSSATATGVVWAVATTLDPMVYKISAISVAGSGTVKPKIAGASFNDVTGNTNIAGAISASSIVLDNVRPSVVLSTPPTSTSNNSTILTLTFSESITGLDVTDFEVSSGSVSALSGSSCNGGSCTLTATVSGYLAGSSVKVKVKDGVFTDAAGNTNQASNQVSFLYTPNEVPVITVQPTAALALNPGASGVLTVAASGMPSPTYQWMKLSGNSYVDIPGAASTNYSVTEAGSYKVKVSNLAGSIESQVSVVTLNVAPTISVQPIAKVDVNLGSTLSLSVTASGVPAPTYKWLKLSGASYVEIPNATSSNYVVSNIQSTDASTYRAVVTNSAGTVMSTLSVVVLNSAPVITLQPASTLSVNPGSSFTFNAAASGSPSPSFQWQKQNGNVYENILNATNSSYNVSVAQISDAGSYRVVVGNTAGTVTSSVSQLQVNTAPVISIQPLAALTVNPGSSASFSVTATGNPGPTYQWQSSSNGGAFSNINGAVSSVYTMSSVSAALAGNYRVIVSNSAGSTTSSNATLAVNSLVNITTQPLAQTVSEGAAATFNVVAVGTAPLSYQWKKNGADISGATALNYTTPIVSNLDQGNRYSVVVSNTVGPVTSSEAVLTVNAKPRIVQNPQSAVMDKGKSVTFSVSATGAAILAYKWKKDSSYISGATSSSYTITSATDTDLGSYTCEVSNGIAPAAVSAAATLTLNPPPVITAQPLAQSINQGQRALFSVTATAATSYQWRKDGVAIDKATTSTYEVAAVLPSNSGQYSVVVTNSNGNVTSANASLTVIEPPTILGFDKLATQGVLVNAVPVNFNLTFSKAITASTLTASDITQDTSATATGVTWVVTPTSDPSVFKISATAVTGSGTLKPKLAAASITDATGNPNALGRVSDQAVTIDLAKPSVILAAPATPTNSNTTNIALTFSEPITGLEATDFNITTTSGAMPTITTQSSCSGTPCIATATVSGYASGATVGVTLGADKVTDLAGNKNTVSNPVSFNYVPDTAPVITLSSGTSIAVSPGTTVTLASDATGSPTPTFQWQKLNGSIYENVSGAKVSGADTKTMIITNAQSSDVGQYRVMISNRAGTVYNVTNVLVNYDNLPCKLVRIDQNQTEVDPQVATTNPTNDTDGSKCALDFCAKKDTELSQTNWDLKTRCYRGNIKLRDYPLQVWIDDDLLPAGSPTPDGTELKPYRASTTAEFEVLMHDLGSKTLRGTSTPSPRYKSEGFERLEINLKPGAYKTAGFIYGKDIHLNSTWGRDPFYFRNNWTLKGATAANIEDNNVPLKDRLSSEIQLDPAAVISEAQIIQSRFGLEAAGPKKMLQIQAIMGWPWKWQPGEYHPQGQRFRNLKINGRFSDLLQAYRGLYQGTGAPKMRMLGPILYGSGSGIDRVHLEGFGSTNRSETFVTQVMSAQDNQLPDDTLTRHQKITRSEFRWEVAPQVLGQITVFGIGGSMNYDQGFADDPFDLNLPKRQIEKIFTTNRRDQFSIGGIIADNRVIIPQDTTTETQWRSDCQAFRTEDQFLDLKECLRDGGSRNAVQGYSVFITDQAIVSNNVTYNAFIGFYNDSWLNKNVRIENNQFLRADSGIAITMDVYANFAFTGINILNNWISVMPVYDGARAGIKIRPTAYDGNLNYTDYTQYPKYAGARFIDKVRIEGNNIALAKNPTSQYLTEAIVLDGIDAGPNTIANNKIDSRFKFKSILPGDIPGFTTSLINVGPAVGKRAGERVLRIVPSLGFTFSGNQSTTCNQSTWDDNMLLKSNVSCAQTPIGNTRFENFNFNNCAWYKFFADEYARLPAPPIASDYQYIDPVCHITSEPFTDQKIQGDFTAYVTGPINPVYYSLWSSRLRTLRANLSEPTATQTYEREFASHWATQITQNIFNTVLGHQPVNAAEITKFNHVVESLKTPPAGSFSLIQVVNTLNNSVSDLIFPSITSFGATNTLLGYGRSTKLTWSAEGGINNCRVKIEQAGQSVVIPEVSLPYPAKSEYFTPLLPLNRGYDGAGNTAQTVTAALTCTNTANQTFTRTISVNVQSWSDTSQMQIYIDRVADGNTFSWDQASPCSVTNPCDGSSALKLDTLLRVIPEKAHIHFIQSGIYETYGYEASYDDLGRTFCSKYSLPDCFMMTKGWSPKSGWTIEGTGGRNGPEVNKTTLKLIGVERVNGQGSVIGVRYDATIKDILIKKIVLDANARGQINQTCTNRAPTSTWYYLDETECTGGVATAGMTLGGSNIFLTDIKIINFGTFSKSWECFALSAGIGHVNIPEQSGVLITDFEISNPAPGSVRETTFMAVGGGVLKNFDGSFWNPYSRSDGRYRNAVVRNGLMDGTGATNETHGGSSSSTYGGALYDGVVFRNITVGMYHDTWNHPEMQIENNVFENVKAGIYMNFESVYQAGISEKITIRNNVIRLLPYVRRPQDSGVYSVGIGLAGSGRAPAYTFNEVDISNNMITYFDSSKVGNRENPTLGIWLRSISSGKINNNTILLNEIDPTQSNSAVETYNLNQRKPLVFYGQSETSKIQCDGNTTIGGQRIYCNQPEVEATKPIDTSAPRIYNVSVDSVTKYVKVWSFDEPFATEIRHGLDPYTLNKSRPFIYGSGRYWNGIHPAGETVYELENSSYFKVSVRDNSGNISTMEKALPLNFQKNTISNIQVTGPNPHQCSLTLSWNTSRPSSSQVAYIKEADEFNADVPYLMTPEIATPTLSHTVTVNGLELGKIYKFKVLSKDAETLLWNYSDVVNPTWTTSVIPVSTFNVAAFGAKGDGVNDDRSAIQNALNCAVNYSTYQSQNNQVTVKFPRGTYALKSSTNNTYHDLEFGRWDNLTKISLEGERETSDPKSAPVSEIRSDTSVAGADPGGKSLLVVFGNNRNFHIKDLVFNSTQGNKSIIPHKGLNFSGGATRKDGNGNIDTEGISDFNISNTYFKNFVVGLILAGADDGVIENSKFLMEQGHKSGLGKFDGGHPTVGVWAFHHENGSNNRIIVRNNFYDGCASESYLLEDHEVPNPHSRYCGDGFLYGMWRNARFYDNTIKRFSFEAINIGPTPNDMLTTFGTTEIYRNQIDGNTKRDDKTQGGITAMRIDQNDTKIFNNTIKGAAQGVVAIGLDSERPVERYNVKRLKIVNNKFEFTDLGAEQNRFSKHIDPTSPYYNRQFRMGAIGFVGVNNSLIGGNEIIIKGSYPRPPESIGCCDRNPSFMSAFAFTGLFWRPNSDTSDIEVVNNKVIHEGALDPNGKTGLLGFYFETIQSKITQDACSGAQYTFNSGTVDINRSLLNSSAGSEKFVICRNQFVGGLDELVATSGISGSYSTIKSIAQYSTDGLGILESKYDKLLFQSSNPLLATVYGLWSADATSSAPQITMQPQSQAKALGEMATFSVELSGTQPISYQWKKNGVDIPGATGSSYTVYSTNYLTLGGFSVVVSNGVGQPVFSSTAHLTINESLLQAMPAFTSRNISSTLDSLTTYTNCLLYPDGPVMNVVSPDDPLKCLDQCIAAAQKNSILAYSCSYKNVSLFNSLKFVSLSDTSKINEMDLDGDGILDTSESNEKTRKDRRDTNGDGMEDGWQVFYSKILDGIFALPVLDRPNNDKYRVGTQAGTPMQPQTVFINYLVPGLSTGEQPKTGFSNVDTDGDFRSDIDEFLLGTNPLEKDDIWASITVDGKLKTSIALFGVSSLPYVFESSQDNGVTWTYLETVVGRDRVFSKSWVNVGKVRLRNQRIWVVDTSASGYYAVHSVFTGNDPVCNVANMDPAQDNIYQTRFDRLMLALNKRDLSSIPSGVCTNREKILTAEQATDPLTLEHVPTVIRFGYGTFKTMGAYAALSYKATGSNEDPFLTWWANRGDSPAAFNGGVLATPIPHAWIVKNNWSLRGFFGMPAERTYGYSKIVMSEGRPELLGGFAGQGFDQVRAYVLEGEGVNETPTTKRAPHNQRVMDMRISGRFSEINRSVPQGKTRPVKYNIGGTFIAGHYSTVERVEFRDFGTDQFGPYWAEGELWRKDQPFGDTPGECFVAMITGGMKGFNQETIDHGYFYGQRMHGNYYLGPVSYATIGRKPIQNNGLTTVFAIGGVVHHPSFFGLEAKSRMDRSEMSKVKHLYSLRSELISNQCSISSDQAHLVLGSGPINLTTQDQIKSALEKNPAQCLSASEVYYGMVQGNRTDSTRTSMFNDTANSVGVIISDNVFNNTNKGIWFNVGDLLATGFQNTSILRNQISVFMENGDAIFKQYFARAGTMSHKHTQAIALGYQPNLDNFDPNDELFNEYRGLKNLKIEDNILSVSVLSPGIANNQVIPYENNIEYDAIAIDLGNVSGYISIKNNKIGEHFFAKGGDGSFSNKNTAPMRFGQTIGYVNGEASNPTPGFNATKIFDRGPKSNAAKNGPLLTDPNVANSFIITGNKTEWSGFAPMGVCRVIKYTSGKTRLQDQSIRNDVYMPAREIWDFEAPAGMRCPTPSAAY